MAAKADVIQSPADALTDAVKSLPHSGSVVEDLFERAYAINEAKDRVLTIRVAIRESLRNLRDAGMLSSAQEEELLALFKPRERKDGTDPDNGDVDDE